MVAGATVCKPTGEPPFVTVTTVISPSVPYVSVARAPLPPSPVMATVGLLYPVPAAVMVTDVTAPPVSTGVSTAEAPIRRAGSLPVRP